MLNSEFFVRKRATKSKLILKKSSHIRLPIFCACLCLAGQAKSSIFLLFRYSGGVLVNFLFERNSYDVVL